MMSVPIKNANHGEHREHGDEKIRVSQVVTLSKPLSFAGNIAVLLSILEEIPGIVAAWRNSFLSSPCPIHNYINTHPCVISVASVVQRKRNCVAGV